MNNYTIKSIKSITSGEVDYQMYNELFTKKGTNKLYEIGHPSDNIIDNSTTDRYGISIKALEKIINQLKTSGANYVAISYNCDHPDYTFEGLNISVSTEEEIAENKRKEVEAEEKANKRQKLIEELKKLN